MPSTHAQILLPAPPSIVYRAILDPQAVATWMVPTGMRSHIHHFEPRPGGAFRISLTYDAPTETGKTSAHTDTYHGHFLRLVPDTLVVQEMEFETSDPAIMGLMRVTYTLTEQDGQTLLHALHEDLPPGVSEADNALGWSLSLGKLAALLESGWGRP